MSNIVILGDDLLSPEQIQQIAGLASPPELTPCASLDEDDEDDGTSPGCCMIDAHTKTASSCLGESKPADTTQALRSYPVPYFFYGRLSDPELWTGRLGFEEAPTFADAEIKGWDLKMWGHYKALIAASEPDKVIKGKLYMVKNEEVLESIAAYETDNYGVRLCEIYYGGGHMLEGCVFAFAGDISHLRTVEEYGLEQRAYEELEAT